jgi:hypothetical protein
MSERAQEGATPMSSLRAPRSEREAVEPAGELLYQPPC